MSRIYFCFDVESIGLHGQAFAVGVCVVDQDGKELDSGRFSCDQMFAVGQPDDRAWVKAHCPDIHPHTAKDPSEVRMQFAAVWATWKARGAIAVADCAWPVEARFLNECVYFGNIGTWDGPYPLHDVATMRLAAALDPLETCERLPSELPKHCPLADARQSARLWIEAMKKIRTTKEQP